MRAGDAATRVKRPSRNVEIVAERPSPRPSIVSTAHGREVRRPGRRRRVRLVMIDEPELRRAERVHAASCRRSASRLSAFGHGPGGHSVIRYFTARVSPASGTGPGLAAADRVVALLAAGPPAAERLGWIGRRGGDDDRSAPGARPACARHASIERVGKRTSSLRRVNRSSFTAKRSRPSCSSAAPESCPSQMPSTFTVLSASR